MALPFMHLYFYQLKEEYHTEILQFNEQDEFVLTVVFKMICCFLASSCKRKRKRKPMSLWNANGYLLSNFKLTGLINKICLRNRNALSGNKVEMLIVSIMVKITRYLTLMSFKGGFLSWVYISIQSVDHWCFKSYGKGLSV